MEMGQISARMLRGRFLLENQDFGVSVGAIGIIFRDTSFPTSPRTQNRLFRKIVPGVQGRRNRRGKNMFTLLGTKSEQGGQICCEADFGTGIKILRYPLGRSASFSEIHLFRLFPGLKIDFFEKLSQVFRVAEIVAETTCLHFWGSSLSKVAKHVARPILAGD